MGKPDETTLTKFCLNVWQITSTNFGDLSYHNRKTDNIGVARLQNDEGKLAEDIKGKE